MSKLFGRRWEILIDNEPFIEMTDGSQFKMTFDVLIDFGGFNSYADIAISNLNPETANKVFKRDAKVTLRAGYVDSIDTIFNGYIRNVLRERNGATTITRLLCNSMILAKDRPHIDATLGKGSKVTEAIRKIVSTLGYALEMYNDQFTDVKPFSHGYTMQGDPMTELDYLAHSYEFGYVIENKRCVIVRKNHHRSGEPVEISQFNGMEGIPEITDVGCDVTVRLNPKLKIGSQFKVTSNLKTFNFSGAYFRDIPESAGVGVYNIYRLNFTGDTWGDAWSTKIVGFAANKKRAS